MNQIGQILNSFEIPIFDGDFHHLGVAVEEIESSSTFFEKLGFTAEGQIFHDEGIQVSILFMTHGSLRIELVSPLTETSPVLGWLKSGSPFYHVGFLVDSVENSYPELKKLGFRKVFGPIPATAFHGKQVLFAMNSKRMLLELIEK